MPPPGATAHAAFARRWARDHRKSRQSCQAIGITQREVRVSSSAQESRLPHRHPVAHAPRPSRGHLLRNIRAIKWTRPRTPMPRAPTTEHARNQAWTKSADAAAARDGEDVGRGSQGGGAKAAGAAVDASRHATQDRPPVSGAGDDPGNARAAIAAITAGVRRAPARHRAGVGRSLSSDPFFDPARPRALHRRGG
jgi:hypothetical protein